MSVGALRLGAVLALVALLHPAVARARPRWLWPVGGPVVGRFHVVDDHFAAGQRRGIDIAAPTGTDVRAACSGRVSFAGAVPRGNGTVSVACGRLSATYLHLTALAVRRGQPVVAGKRLGSVAPGGVLRLGARLRSSRFGYVDPLRLLGDEPAVRRVDPVRIPPSAPLGRAPAERPVVAPLPRAIPVRAVPVRGEPLGLPLGGVWIPAGLGCLLAGFVVEAARRAGRAAQGPGDARHGRDPAGPLRPRAASRG